MGDWGGKPDKESINKKPLNQWGGRGGKPKDHKCRYCQWKNLSTWTKNMKRKTKIGRERRDVVWLMRDLDDKGLGQNKMLCDSSKIELPMVNYYAGSPALYQGDRSLATHRLLALKPHWLGFFLVASFLLSYLAHFLACFINCPCFCFVESWIVGLERSLGVLI